MGTFEQLICKTHSPVPKDRIEPASFKKAAKSVKQVQTIIVLDSFDSFSSSFVKLYLRKDSGMTNRRRTNRNVFLLLIVSVVLSLFLKTEILGSDVM